MYGKLYKLPSNLICRVWLEQQVIKCVNSKHSKFGGKLSNEFVKQFEFIFNVFNE